MNFMRDDINPQPKSPRSWSLLRSMVLRVDAGRVSYKELAKEQGVVDARVRWVVKIARIHMEELGYPSQYSTAFHAGDFSGELYNEDLKAFAERCLDGI